MNVSKIFSTIIVFFIFLSSFHFYGQDVCTNHTLTPGTVISSSGAGTVYNSIINVSDSYIITDVNVTVNISHTWNADLDIFLISPSGSIVELSTDNGGSGDNYNNVTFDDASTNTLPSGNTTISGTYRPEGTLADFNGQNSNGNWTLRVIDDASGDGGIINSITINLCRFATIDGYLGPGGVGTVGASNNLVLWLKPGVVGNTGSLWKDSSGRGFDFSGGNGATLNSTDTNGYDSYSFNGTNQYFEKSYEAALNPQMFSVFTVSNVTSSSNYKAVISNRDDPPGTPTRGFILYALPNTNYWEFWNGVNSTSWQVTASTTSTVGSWNIQSIFYQNSTNGKKLFINDNIPFINTHNLSVNSLMPFRVGAGRNESTPDYYFQGKISEVIMFDKTINTAQQIIINNYLSAKFNTPLTTNDLYIQDIPGRGNFDHNVAGIGQASDGSNHTDSQGTGIVRVNNPSALSNNEFLFWGEETKDPTYNFSTNTINFTEQLNSKWRVNHIGNLGTVTVSFDISSFNFTGKPSCSLLQLVIDNSVNMASPLRVYDLTIVGNTATATGVIFGNNNYFTLRYADQIVWNGSSFFNGGGVGNEPIDTNSCLKFIVKAGTTTTLNLDAHVREIEVEAGATLNVANGILLEVENGILNNGTIDLLGEAQIIQTHVGTTLNYGSGSLKIRQQGTTNVHNYNYWSSPVNRGGNWQIRYLEDAVGAVNFTSAFDGNTATLPITLSTRWLYKFNGPVGDYNAWLRINTTTNIAPGVGYTLKGSGAGAATPEQEFVFRGTANDGDYPISVTAGNEILIGNPYPSALDANAFINDNLSRIDGTLYFWESFTSNNSHYLADYEGGYATYNLMMSSPAIADFSGLTSGSGLATKPAPTRYVPVGQGFFTIISTTGALTFNNSQRAFARESLGQTVYYKTASKKKSAVMEDNRPKIWFSFTQPKGYTKYLGLGYDTNTTYGYDKGYDAKLYDSFKNDVFWLLNDEPLVIQALPEINTNDELPLGIKIRDVGIYKFAIDKMENVPDDLNIYLRDNNQNTYYNLRNGEVPLVLNNQTDLNQFSIVFKEENALSTTTTNSDTFGVSYNPNTKNVAVHTKLALSTMEAFHIYNTIGQLVLSEKSPRNSNINLSHIPDGVYFIKIDSKTDKNLKTVKFVKY